MKVIQGRAAEMSNDIGAQRHRPVSRALVGGASAIVLAIALSMMGAQASVPAGPYELGRQEVGVFLTRWEAETVFCARNIEVGVDKPAEVRVTPAPRTGRSDEVRVEPSQTRCFAGSWSGAPIIAANISTSGATVVVWTELQHHGLT